MIAQMDEKQKQRADQLSKLIWRHYLASFHGKKFLKLFLLVGVTGLFLLFFLWPAIRPERNFIAHEIGVIKSHTTYQSKFRPPSIILLLETADGNLTTVSTRVSFGEIRGDTVCLKKFQNDASDKESYMITLPSNCVEN